METIKNFGEKKITVRNLSKRDLKNVKIFQDFINSFVEGDAQIMMNEKISLKDEGKWLKEKLRSIKKKEGVFLVAEHDDKIVGSVGIDSMIWRQNHIGNSGITIKKGYRGIGIGSYLMKKAIKLAKKELKTKPKIIRLNALSTNKPALGLYKKIGFKKVAEIPRQIQYKGKLVSEVIMLLEL